MELCTAIKNRRSIRNFQNRKVGKETLKRVVFSGCYAPSAHNFQPWNFLVLLEKNKLRLVNLLLTRKGSFSIAIKPVILDAARVLGEAPAAILGFRTKTLERKFAPLGKMYVDNATLFENQSVACAFQNIQLTAYSLNLGTAWLGILNFFGKDIEDMFKNHGSFFGALAIGFPESKNRLKPKKLRGLSKVLKIMI